MKNAEKEKARDLRSKNGLPIKEISKILNVAKSTVSLWVRDIALSEEQHNSLRLKNPIYNRQLNGRLNKTKKHALLRGEYRKDGIKKACENNILHAIGCMLYWGEGSKSDRYSVGMANSDPYLLKLFKKFLNECYDVKDSDITLHIHCHTNSIIEISDIEKYWINMLSLSPSNLRKTIVNNISKYSKRKRTNNLKYGTCHLNVHNVKIKQSIIGAIEGYGGFIQESWH